jgi:hypothetical protein
VFLGDSLFGIAFSPHMTVRLGRYRAGSIAHGRSTHERHSSNNRQSRTSCVALYLKTPRKKYKCTWLCATQFLSNVQAAEEVEPRSRVREHSNFL